MNDTTQVECPSLEDIVEDIRNRKSNYKQTGGKPEVLVVGSGIEEALEPFDGNIMGLRISSTVFSRPHELFVCSKEAHSSLLEFRWRQEGKHE